MKKEIKEIAEKLKAINSIISKLDLSIRVAAFEFLKPVFFGESFHENAQSGQPDKLVIPKGDVRDFYASFNPGKPADSVLILAAWIYTQKGSSPFSLEELEGLFDEVGVPRPNRLDMTLRNCSRSGKKLFQNASRGNYRPTVYGENHFKADMNLRPGKNS